VVVDVGANIGALAVSCATAVGPSGRVFAIEANPSTFRYLTENVELNGLSQVTCLNYAAGAQSGELRFTDDVKSAEQNTVDPEGPLVVPSEPLDALIPPDVDIAVLKIDVEGFEKFVLQGASATLGRTKRVYLEVWDDHFQRFGYRTGDVLEALSGAGFETYRVDEEGQLFGTEGAGRVCENLLALRA
jgi:FkbM family methyltransferase